MALSMNDMTTENRECRVFEYDKVPVNTAELAENLSYERLLTLHWNKVARSDYWLFCLAPNLLIQN